MGGHGGRLAQVSQVPAHPMVPVLKTPQPQVIQLSCSNASMNSVRVKIERKEMKKGVGVGEERKKARKESRNRMIDTRTAVINQSQDARTFPVNHPA